MFICGSFIHRPLPTVHHPMTYHLQITETYPRITILHHIEPDGSLWGTSGRAVMRKQQDSPWQEIAHFPFIPKRDTLAFTRPAARALRADKANLYLNQAGHLIGIRASTVYKFATPQPPTPIFTINGDSVLHGSICEDPLGWTYFGEYFMNPQRDPVRIWRLSPDLSSWEVARTFPAGQIRHVHGIYRDPFNPDSLWASTGDFQGECHLYNTTDRFTSLKKFGDGSQIFRAVRLFFTPNYICWLTDSNLDQNYACRLNRSSGQLELGQKLPASTWYGTQTQEGLYIAFTTIEPGPAVQTRRSEILVSQDAFHWQSIHSFKKDFWRPMKVFKYGVISCPSGLMSNDAFYISGEGLIGLDGRSLKLSITQEAA